MFDDATEDSVDAYKAAMDATRDGLDGEKKAGSDNDMIKNKAATSAAGFTPLKLQTKKIKQPAKINDVNFHSAFGGGEFVAMACQDGKAFVYNTKDASMWAAFILNTWLNVVEFNPCGKKVAVGGLDNCVTVFDMPDLAGGQNQGDDDPVGKQLMKHGGPIYTIKWLSDTEVLSGSGDGTVMLWDVSKGGGLVKDPVQIFKGHMGDCASIAVIDESTFLCGSADTYIKTHDKRVSHHCGVVATYAGHSAPVMKITKLKCGPAFLSVSEDGTCRGWDIRSMHQVLQIGEVAEEGGETDPMTAVATSKSDRFAFIGTDSGTLKSYDLLCPGEPVSVMKHHLGKVTAIEVSRDGFLMASCSSNTEPGFNFGLWG